jgi:hypothetical protein
MERTLLTLTPANVITITLCGLLGYALIVLAAKLYSKMTGGSMNAGGSNG